jgi:hypothetical protein
VGVNRRDMKKGILTRLKNGTELADPVSKGSPESRSWLKQQRTTS